MTTFVRTVASAALTLATYCGLAVFAACIAMFVVLIFVSGGLW